MLLVEPPLYEGSTSVEPSDLVIVTGPALGMPRDCFFFGLDILLFVKQFSY